MLKRNLIANYFGQAFNALLSLAFVPFYIKYLGMEAYGLIGLFAVLQAWLGLLDMGMTPTLGREMARFTGGSCSTKSIRDLLRSIEIIALFVAFLMIGGIALGSNWIATSWLKADALPTAVVAQAFEIMGLVTGLRFLEGVYRSAIIGLQRQVLLNVVNSVMASIRFVGVFGILVWVSPTIKAFFMWQGVVSMLSIIILALITYASLPSADRPSRFSLTALRGVSRFAGGIMAITFLSLLLMQVDKVLLSRQLSLAMYGNYMLAVTIAGVLYVFVNPIGQAWFPKLSELYSSGDKKSFCLVYHQGAQLVSASMGSMAIILIFFSEHVVYTWTQNIHLSRQIAPLVSIVALGNLLNGLMWIPYQAQLASGWTSLATRINLVSVAILVPSLLVITPRYGAEGAAWVWVCLNASYVTVGISLMHVRILTSEQLLWYKNDVAQPIGLAIFVALFIGKLIPTWPSSPILQFVVLVAITFFTLIASCIGSQVIRGWFYQAVVAKASFRGTFHE